MRATIAGGFAGGLLGIATSGTADRALFGAIVGAVTALAILLALKLARR